MIIRQTTTIVFEYPQDYLQEQEWCKTKEDRWVHKGTDTLGAVYENQISYSIGATADRKIEPQTCITEDRTQMLDRWQTYHRNTTSAVTPCSNCQEFDCYGCEYQQTERGE